MSGSDRSPRLFRSLAVCALFLGCTEVTPPAQTAAPTPTASAVATATASAPHPYQCAVRGTVLSDKGAPVPGAIVAAIPAGTDEPAAVAKADAKGWYCLLSLEAGNYGFTITSADLTAEYVDVRGVSPATMKSVSLDFHLGGPGHALSGLVVDDKGAPLKGARVSISRFSNFMADSFVTETGDDGRYRVMLPEATYSVFIRAETYLADRVTVALKKDETANLAAQSLNPKRTPAPEEVVAWLKSKAIPLAGPEAGRTWDDMAPLAAIVGDARLVGLGEATHGTREFFQMKHRMLEYLVEKKGFRIFGIEASLGDCLPLTEYVRTGKGDPADALANQGFWTWNTEEVLALVKWMRAYNEDKAHKEKLSFWGYDMQSPAASAHALLAFFAKADASFAKEIGPPLEPVDDDFTAHHLDGVTKAEMASVTETAKKIVERLEAKKDEYRKKLDDRSVALAQIHARILVDFLASEAGDGALRDRSMADIASALLALEDLPPKTAGGAASSRGSVKASSPPAKMVLWAHNGHVNKEENGGAPSMGSFLARRHGAEYVVFGFAFDEGSFQAIDFGKDHRGLIPFTVPPSAAGTLDRTLGRTGIPLFALDLHAAASGPGADWLAHAVFTRSIGAVFDETVTDYGQEPIVLSRQFDALFFVQKTTAARPTKTGVWSPKTAGAALPRLTDPGFEATKTGETPEGFHAMGMPRQLEYKVIVTDKGCAKGSHCLTLERTKGDVTTGIGSAAVGLDAKPLRGRAVLVTATLRVEGKGPGDEAFLMAFAREDAVRWSRVPGSAWKKVEFEFQVSDDAETLRVGFAATGAARAMMDELYVQVLPN